jgi:putative nucleotidyltransferase with HDIG domain
MAVRRALYRIRQFRRTVRARPRPKDLWLLGEYLSPSERRLFFGTSPRDQHHHIETLRLLHERGEVPRHLARAALLHDVGKGYVHLHERVAYVLLARFAPRVLERVVQRGPGGPLGGLSRIHRHAQLGADALRALGAEERVIELVARHHLPPGEDTELRALIDADDRA